ncbi:outer membrane beta-barrel protein [Terriglobus roseus]|uniref:Putative beta-barrel porin-2, OmpL-like. bbp2 n=1 Tax=Terriglobus roseus TaxID=392734 RepID=A0A1H4N1W0_9BACT|nr:outer membrane beta-barrel protein [Terriglobus roseus]SEB89213.1 Putative beta-barrel porin-2, OmpL-like. bbp2 [Terriglobus roseus]
MLSGRIRTQPARYCAFAVVLAFGMRVTHAQQPSPQYRTPTAANDPSAVQTAIRGNFVERLARFYVADWRGTLPVGPAPTRRAFDAPIDSPPFPAGDWIYGGSPTIGVPDTTVYPLMTALKMENRRTKIYGWAKGTYNQSTSHDNNYPLVFASKPNTARLHQVVTFIERLPDTVQNKRFDWGYHVTALYYGIDYRFTTTKGVVSGQLLVSNRTYGYDPLTEYVDLYFPVKDGLNLRVGRFLELPGLDSPLAPANYTMTRSLVYAAEPVTETGAVATLKLNKQWLVQVGLTAGHDVAPWSSGHKPSLIACVDYSTTTNHDNFYACANGINDGKYAYDNVQQYDMVWAHKFNAKWHMATEGWVMYQRGVPSVAQNLANPVPTEDGTLGAMCAPGQLRCFAPEYAIVSYLNREISPSLTVGFRADLLNDKKGQRTGTATKYTENTLYLNRYFGSTFLVQTDLRFDHSWDKRGYNNGRARNQLVGGISLVHRY